MWRWLTNNHQTLTGIGAMLVGIAALFVAWDQGRVMRAQQHGAVVPVIQLDGFITSTLEQREMGLRIQNNGVGPAMIGTVELLRDGEPTTDFDPLLLRMPAGFDRSWSSVTGRALAPNGVVEPVVFRWDRDALDQQGLDDVLAEWSRWDMRLCYCSVFDRCWVATASNARRIPVRQCTGPTDDIFEIFGNAETPDSARPQETLEDGRDQP